MIASVIPARGGSKAIPKKNITPLLENPLITYTIEQSLASERVDETFVSTDDDEIANVSADAGASVIERPPDIAGDKSPTEDTLVHALSEIRDRGFAPDTLVLLQCTSPLRREDDIDATVQLVTEKGYDSAFSCCEDHKFYWEVNDDTAVPINYDPQQRSMRQDVAKRYQENGSIYAMTTEVLESEHCRLGGRIGVHEMPEPLSFEIDTHEDLRLVERIGREFEFYHGGLLD